MEQGEPIMKKTLAVGLFFLLCIIHLSAQDQDQFNEGQTASFPNFALSSIDYYLQFKLADGTSLKYKEFKELIRIPENEKLLRRAEGWHITAWISTVAWIGARLGSLYYTTHKDASYADEMRIGLDLVELVSFGALIIAGVEMPKNMTRAIDNYNLSIMGIPIPVK
jgi:hypothetical protein